LYYQDSQTDELGGEKADSPSGAGFTADLEFTWHPALPVVEDGEFFVRIHAGNAAGADKIGGGSIKPADVLLGNLNTIADDNSDEDDDTGLRFLEAHYTHHFFDEMLSITAGKAEQLGFLDDNVFSTPFLGSQLTVAPKFGELEGNYGFYGWYTGYNHSKLDADRNPIDGEKEKGWGVGISADQQVTEIIGLFGRFAWNNDDVYVVQWEASGGVNLTGLVPGREEDTIGIGFAGLVPDSRYTQDDSEYHLELYYRIAVAENLAFTPDVQYVWNPGGDSDSDGVFDGMVRAEFNF
jgi:hypothetical protein